MSSSHSTCMYLSLSPHCSRQNYESPHPSIWNSQKKVERHSNILNMQSCTCIKNTSTISHNHTHSPHPHPHLWPPTHAHYRSKLTHVSTQFHPLPHNYTHTPMSNYTQTIKAAPLTHSRSHPSPHIHTNKPTMSTQPHPYAHTHSHSCCILHNTMIILPFKVSLRKEEVS